MSISSIWPGQLPGQEVMHRGNQQAFLIPFFIYFLIYNNTHFESKKK